MIVQILDILFGIILFGFAIAAIFLIVMLIKTGIKAIKEI